MNILKKLSLTGLKLNKKRTIGTIIGIILSTSLICAVSCMLVSFQSTLVQNAINEEGYYHLKINEIDESDIKALNVNRDIKNIKTMYDLGYAIYNEESEDYPYIHILSSDHIKDLSFKITEGRRPTNSNELIVSRTVLMETDLKIGDTITLNIGKRVTNDGSELNKYNPYIKDEEKLIDTKEKTYKIVGSFEKRDYNYTPYGITTKETSDKIDAFIALKHPKKYKEDIPNILNQKDYNETQERDLNTTKYNYEINSELLRWEAFAFSDSTVTMLTTVVSVVIVIIIVSSVYCIKNSFEISVTEKTKMYGMLSSIGATKKQIKKCVIYEGLILGLIGIPIGIISGVFADFVLIKIVNKIFDGMLFASLDEIIFDVSLFSILISIILGFITIYLSCIKTAKKASKVSPIKNITNAANIKLNSKKLTTPKIINKIFGIGGVLAYKNLKRSKKKYRTTVISITISVLVFISMNSFLNETFILSSSYYDSYEYNIEFHNVNNLTDADINKIRKMNDTKELYTLYETTNHDYIKIYDNEMLNTNNDIITPSQDCFYDEVTDERICNEEYYSALQIISLDDKSYRSYVSKLGLKYNDIKTKGILIDGYKYYVDGKEQNIRSYKYKSGDTIKGKYNDKDISIIIGNIATIRPYGIENSYSSTGFLLVNKDYFKEFSFSPGSLMIDSTDVDETIKYVESLDNNISSSNYEEAKRQDNAMKLVISIFLYGFITVITLIGVTSIFNTITSNMELRSKEFAVLKSIGMTKKEFKHMVNLETLFYSFKSLIYGIILGILGSYLIHQGFKEKTEMPYNLPIIPILIAIISVFLLVYIIMKFSINKINKQNTIETIRKDNI